MVYILVGVTQHMLTLLIMAAGVLIGMRWFPPSLQKYNSILQTLCTSLLIFSMGVSLGSRPEFFSELRAIGLYSLLFAGVSILLSTIVVFLLTKWFMEGRHGHRSNR